MPKKWKLDLSEAQQQELVDLRDHGAEPYLRERAAALLKVAAGWTGLQVAQYGLLKARDPDTVYSWIRHYVAEGIDGLKIRAGRGRKPKFFPPVARRDAG